MFGISVLTRVLVFLGPGLQLVLPPCDVVIKAVADYVRNIQDTSDLDAIAKDVFQHSQVNASSWVVLCALVCAELGRVLRGTHQPCPGGLPAVRPRCQPGGLAPHCFSSLPSSLHRGRQIVRPLLLLDPPS